MLGAVRLELSLWRRGGLALLALLGLSFGGTASAQLNVLITKGIERPTPMAIVPFGWSGSGPTGLRHRGRRVGRPEELGPVRADRRVRHGFAADAARPGSTSRIGGCSKSITS